MWLASAEQLVGNSAGSMNGDGSRKILLHSTEGSSIGGAVSAYRAHNSWPTLTVDCRLRRVVQHLDTDVAARSLRNQAGGVETNRDGTVLVQIELVGFAGDPSSIGHAEDLLWLGREVIRPIAERHGVPLASTLPWVAYPASYGQRAGQRLSPGDWDAYSGILGHQHAPENDHGDPGAIDIATILAGAVGAETEDDYMAMFPTPEDFVEAVANGTSRGLQRLGLATADDVVQNVAYGVQRAFETEAVRAALARGDEVDEAALAATLAPLLVGSARSLSEADLTAVASAVADEQARRQAE